MAIIITYDIEKTTNTIHEEVKLAMIAKGYQERISMKSGGYAQLPNTTLIHDSVTTERADLDLTAVCTLKKAKIEKYLILNVDYENGRVKSDE